MMHRARNIIVKQIPETLNRRSEAAMLREVEASLTVERPALVFDCSRVRQMDLSIVHLLLCSLEFAMKRNGDVRLAKVSAQAKHELAAMDVARLFRLYDSTESAVDSFQRKTVGLHPHHGVTETAASGQFA